MTTEKSYEKKAMFGFPLSDLLNYANYAYLLSLFLTFVLTATLWKIQVLSQNESESQLEKYKADAAARISEADARAQAAEANAAQANAAAAKANLEILQIRTPRALAGAQRDSVIAAARRFPGTIFESAVHPYDVEAGALLSQVESALTEAGWIQRGWSGPGDVTYTRAGRPSAGIFDGTGIGLAIREGATAPTIAAKDTVMAAMGLTHTGTEFPVAIIGTATDCIRLLVGAKQI